MAPRMHTRTLDMSSRKPFSRRRFGALALAPLGRAIFGSEHKQTLPLDPICGRMTELDDWRARTLLGYSCARRYTLRHGNSGEPAEMVVQVEYACPGRKSFQTISQKNAGFLEDQIFRRLLHAEIQAARDNIRDSTRIVPANYDFAVLGIEALDGRSSYVIRVRPRRKERLLVDGKIWVDSEYAAVARVEGRIDTGSFWVRNAHTVQSYSRIGPYWLAASNQSDANVRILGEVRLRIDCFDYHLRTA